ncbi:MAG: hypothetical protein JWR68_2296 [Polaromonas sp.]|nr:hypothetical protein [Polaromonas sp.]
MPLHLLHQISKVTLPITITDPQEISTLRKLRSVHQLAVLLPSPCAKKPFARVLAITREGREALSRFDASPR